MYIRPSEPRSIGGVLDDAIRLYRESFALLWPLTLAAAVVIAIPSVLMAMRIQALGLGSPQAGLAGLAVMQSPSYWLTYFVVMVVYLLIYNAIISALDAIATGRPTSLSAALSNGASRLPQSVGAGILLAFIVGIGCVLLLIPGIYLWGIFQLTFVPLVAERTSVGESLSISRRLIKGYWWRTATITATMVIILVVLRILAGVLGGVLVGLSRSGFSTALLVTQISGAVATFLTLSLPIAAAVVMYHDLKLRHEGGDLATRVDALAAR